MKKISEAFFARPWAVKEAMLQTMSEIVSRHVRGEKLSIEEIEARIGEGKQAQPAYQVIDGKAIVPICGVISKRMSMLSRVSGGCSTREVRSGIQEALKDPNVKEIYLDVDSPGGSVDGTPELADFILSCRGKKPITAFANGQMCSAAYWIGSAADRIVATRSTEVGSIGVYSVISDYTVQNHNEGIKTEVIKAGRYKASGHPDKPMTAEDRNVIQEEINAYYDLFVEAVAQNRGISLEEAQALADGRVHIGQKAMEAGLIDEIGELEEALMAGSSPHKGSRLSVADEADDHIQGEKTQVQTSAHNAQQEGKDMDLKDLTLEQLRASRADLCNTLIAEGKAEGIAEGKAAGAAETKTAQAAEERARTLAIVKAANTEFKGKGMEAIVEQAIESGKTVDASLADMRKKRLDDIEAAGNKAPGADGEAVEGEDIVKKAEAYMAEHKGTFAEAMRAVSPVRKQEQK